MNKNENKDRIKISTTTKSTAVKFYPIANKKHSKQGPDGFMFFNTSIEFFTMRTSFQTKSQLLERNLKGM